MRLVSDKGMAWLNRAVISGRIVPYLVAMMLAIMLVAAATVHFLSPKAFATWGDEIWWAAQTVTTVGYGDVVPSNTAGKIVASVVMFTGIALITVVSGAVASGLVQTVRRKRGMDTETQMLQEIERLHRRLDELGAPPRD
jgi:voltage-gated potassium channel